MMVMQSWTCLTGPPISHFRIATAGISSSLIALFVLDLFVDRFGPRMTVCTGSLIAMCGSLLIAFSNDHGPLIGGACVPKCQMDWFF